MGKDNDVEVSEITASLDNAGSQQIVIQMKAMPLAEKKRIEELIDKRAEVLTEYLNDMENSALEVNSHCEEISPETQEIEKAQAQLKLELEALDGAKNAELKGATTLLRNELAAKVTRLKNLITKIENKYGSLINEVDEVARKKFLKKEGDLGTRKIELDTKLANLQKLEAGRKFLRKTVLKNSIQSLKMDVQDYRNKAVEKLYTEVRVNSEAVKCLEMLPDATNFKKEVTPEKVFTIFNIEARPVLEQKILKCRKCGGTNLRVQNGGAYCLQCSSYDILPDGVKKLVLLPSLQEIQDTTKKLEMPLKLTHAEVG